MKKVKTIQRYQCDFCKKRSIKSVIEKHEKRCFRNPNRFCDYCNNKGYTTECHGDLIEDGDCGLSERVPCPYCASFDKKKLEEIEARENSNKKTY
jgi:hypothetical protein